MARSATLLRLAGALVLVVPLGASAQTAPVPREDLEAVAAAFDAAVRAAAPAGGISFGGAATRAYVLPGVGALFVVPPRALPSARVTLAGRQRASHLHEAIAQLEESLRRVHEPEARAQLERTLEALRRTLAEVRRTRPVLAPVPRPPRAPAPPEDVMLALPEAAELAQAVQRDIARQMRAFEEAQRAQGRAWQEQWEAQVRAMSEQSDAFRREAERARQEAERALQEQLSAWSAQGMAPPAPPAPAAPPAPPAGPATPAVAPAPAPAARPAPLPPPAPMAPWTSWLGLDEEESEPGAPDAVVGEVREAVLAVIEAQRPRLLRLAADGSIAVAVDFVPRGPLPRRVQRTLVLRVTRQDLEARAAGRLAPQEFRKRVAVTEY
jgi:hypothetical protein